MDAQNFSKNLPGGLVGKFAKRVQRVLRAGTRFELFPDALSFVLGLWSEHGQGSQRTLHGFSGPVSRIKSRASCGRHSI
jgi:hypothetical protein